MRNKLLSIAMIVFIVMISACANSGNKWTQDTAKNGASTERDWQQNHPSKNDQKKTSNSYWSEEGRY